MTKRICKHCGSEYEITTGLKNYKNLFRKPTLDDWITLFIICMVLVAAWAYNYDTKTCRDTLNNLDEICIKYSASMSNISINYLKSQEQYKNINLTEWEILFNNTEDDK